MKIRFHTFALGDVDDIDIYAAEPISQWLSSEKGRWANKHARDLTYLYGPDPGTFGYKVVIEGHVDDGPLLTEYLLRWGKTES